MFGTKYLKINRFQRPSNTKQINRGKIFDLKYGNTKLLGKAKYNQVKLVHATCYI